MRTRSAPHLYFGLALVLGAAALYFALRASQSAENPSVRAPGIASAEPDHPAADLAEPEIAAVTGKIVDEAGTPLANVRVRLWFLPEIAYLPQTLLRRSLSASLELEARTDGAGLFAIPVPPQSRAHALALVEEPERAPIYARAFDLLGGRSRELGVLELGRGGRLEARVRRTDGSPPGEPVRATLLHALESMSSAHAPSSPLGATRDVRALSGDVDPLTGLCVIDLVPPGRYVLALESAREGHLAPALSTQFEIESGLTTPLDVEVTEGTALRVHVRDARGAHLPGASVELVPDSSALPRELVQRAITDAEGRFATERAPRRADLLVRVSQIGFQRVERRVDTREPEQSFLLQPEVALRGIVRDARTGAPLPDVWIGSFPADEADRRPLERPTWATRGVLPGRTDAGGRFVLPSHSTGRWQVVAKHPDYLLERSAPQVVENGVELPPIELLLDPGIAIDVRFAEPSGVPLAEAGVTLHREPIPGDAPEIEGRYAMPPRGLKIYDATTDAGGGTSFRLLRPGRYRLYVKHARWPAAPPFEIELAAEPRQRAFDLALQEPGAFRGAVTLDGLPTRERKIFAVHASGFVFEALPDEAGRYEIPLVPPGSYVLTPRERSIEVGQVAWEAFGEGVPEKKPAIRRELAPGSLLDQDFALEGPKLARVAGALSLGARTYTVWLVPAEQAVAARGVVPLPGSLAQHRSATTDASGRFAFADVPYGAYRLVVTPAGASPIANADPRTAAERTFQSFDTARALLVREVSIDGPEVDLGFLAERTASASGQIVDAAGAPVGPGFLFLERGSLGAIRAEIDASGRFDLGELPLGELELSIHLAGDWVPITRATRFDGGGLRIVL